MDVDEFMAFMDTRPKGEHWDLIEGVAVMIAEHRASANRTQPVQSSHQRFRSTPP
jgi:hypothetical protein